MYCLQARPCIIQPGNFRSWGSEGVNRLLRCGELSRWNNYGAGVKCNIISHNVFKTLSGKTITESTVKLTSHHIKTVGTTNLTRVCKNTKHNVQQFCDGNGQYSNSRYRSVPEARSCWRIWFSWHRDPSRVRGRVQRFRLSSWWMQNQGGSKRTTCRTCSGKGTSGTRLVCKAKKSDHIHPILETLHWLPVTHRIQYKILTICFNSISETAPQYLSDLLQPYTPARQLRSASDTWTLVTPPCKHKNIW